MLPLEFVNGEGAESLGLTGEEEFDVGSLGDAPHPRQEIQVRARRPDKSERTFKVLARLDSAVEIDYFRNGGILHTVIRNIVGPPSP